MTQRTTETEREYEYLPDGQVIEMTGKEDGLFDSHMVNAKAFVEFISSQCNHDLNTSKFVQWIDSFRTYYITSDGWQLLGSMYNISAVITGTKTLTDSNGNAIGVEATASLRRMTDDEIIGGGVSVCLFDDTRDSYGEEPSLGRQYLTAYGMAQTRAISRAFKHKLSFITALANFETTPAEEMRGIKPSGNQQMNNTPPRQSGRVYASPDGQIKLCKTCDERIQYIENPVNGPFWRCDNFEKCGFQITSWDWADQLEGKIK